MNRPAALNVIAENVPAEMRAESRWSGWRYVLIEGAWKKIPYRVDKPDEEAKVNVAEHWGSFDDAFFRYRSAFVTKVNYDPFDGIGFLLGDGWSGVDVDDCIDESGQINAFARDVIAKLNSYTERSPSGQGVKIFVRAWLGKNHTRAGLEIYGGRRYFTVTGQHV